MIDFLKNKIYDRYRIGGVLIRSRNKILNITLAISLLTGSLFVSIPQKAAAATYNRSNLCSDSAFIDKNKLTLTGIQSFLTAKGSFLKSYSEGGRTAAKIIYDAAQAYGINPIAIMSTIQKEEGLIYGTYSKSYNQVRMDWAMGYGYTDSKIYDQYKGFSNQIDNGTWQLRRNYDYWATNGSVWNVGKTMSIDGTSVTFANKCTSSLYRYTPHLGGNYTFWYYFTNWNGSSVTSAYDGSYVSRSPESPYTVTAGTTFTATVRYKNTGTSIWYKTGSNPVRLGTQDPQDRTSSFFNGNRLEMVASYYRPGATASFTGTFTAPSQPGTYIERFRPVSENNTWFGDEMRWVFYVQPAEEDPEVEDPVDDVVTAEGYNAVKISQTPGYTSLSRAKGQTFVLWVTLKNTGQKVWTKTDVSLGTYDEPGRDSVFLTDDNISLYQSSVKIGYYGTFKAYFKAPQAGGRYVETFRPRVGENAWFGPEITWTINVPYSPGEQQIEQNIQSNILEEPESQDEEVDDQQEVIIEPVSIDGYGASIVSQTPGANSLVRARGQVFVLWVALKNTGTTTWTNTDVSLGTYDEPSRDSVFLKDDKVSLLNSSVRKGSTGTFKAFFVAPRSPGVYTETFRPRVGEDGWFGPEVTWKITVK